MSACHVLGVTGRAGTVAVHVSDGEPLIYSVNPTLSQLRALVELTGQVITGVQLDRVLVPCPDSAS